MYNDKKKKETLGDKIIRPAINKMFNDKDPYADDIANFLSAYDDPETDIFIDDGDF